MRMYRLQTAVSIKAVLPALNVIVKQHVKWKLALILPDPRYFSLRHFLGRLKKESYVSNTSASSPIFSKIKFSYSQGWT